MNRDWTTHASHLDASVNFLATTEDDGSFESRFVQRDPSYFIAYLSSQSGCDQACRFCHLTQMRETRMQHATIDDYVDQAMQVFAHHDRTSGLAGRVHVNFMARGEPLLNPNLQAAFPELAARIGDEAANRDLEVVYNISSIFPRGAADVDLVSSFSGFPVTFFWSLYSLDPAFRKRWLPKAADPAGTLDRLVEWQMATGREVVIHHAMIAGRNDRLCDFLSIRDFLDASPLKARINLVRYNSYSERTGQEADDAAYKAALSVLVGRMRLPGSRIVPRVGRDVAASCGMFMS